MSKKHFESSLSKETPSNLKQLDTPGQLLENPKFDTSIMDNIIVEKTDNKSLWIKLISKSTCKSLSSDVIDGCKDLTEEIVRELCDIVKSKSKTYITLLELKEFIGKEVVSDSACIFPQHTFLSMIKNVLIMSECKLCNESVYLLQIYIEIYMIKLLNGAEMVKESSKRKRVLATDLLISYQINKL